MTVAAEILNYMKQTETEMSFLSGVSIKQETSQFMNQLENSIFSSNFYNYYHSIN